MDALGNSSTYLWEVPGKFVSVRLNLAFAERISAAVLQGFDSLPRRGLETGGLLLGRATRRDGGVIVEIEDFEPLASEHAVGPSYMLSGDDRLLLEERIAWHKASARRLPIVGFYRSHTRKDFAITVEDVDLLNAYFTKPSDVLLLIKPNGREPGSAGFIIREAGKFRSMAPYKSFPLERAALAALCQSPAAEPVAPDTKPVALPREPAMPDRRTVAPAPVAQQPAPVAPAPVAPAPVAPAPVAQQPTSAVSAPVAQQQAPAAPSPAPEAPPPAAVTARLPRAFDPPKPEAEPAITAADFFAPPDPAAWGLATPAVTPPPPARGRRRLVWAYAAAALLVVGSFAAGVRRGVDSKSAVSSDPLALRVSREGAMLRLDWDRQSPAIKSAKRAVLWINDGGTRKELDMDGAQVATGGVVYWPTSGDVSFRLDVFAPTLRASESLRAFGVPPAAPAPVMASQAPAPPASPVTASQAAPSASTSIASLQASPAAFARPWDAPSRAITVQDVPDNSADRVALLPSKPSLRPFVMASPAAVAPATDALDLSPPEPTQAVRDLRLGEVSPHLVRPAPPSRPQVPDPLVRVEVEPVHAARAGSEDAFGKGRQKAGFTPPEAIRDAAPEVPQSLRPQITHAVPIDVKVFVDKSGKVQYAELLSDGLGRNHDLATFAVFSARRWEFTPARSGDQTVPGEVILRYRFGPETRQ